MSAGRHLASLAAGALVLASALALTAHAQELDCLQCHQALSQKKTVHPALSAGCKVCHSALDAAVFPHKVTGKIEKGLSAEPPELCHNCHDRKAFEGKITHAPAAGGMCVFCHDPHASDQAILVKKQPAAVCLECHADIKKRPHVIASFGGRGHPLGDEKEGKLVGDPSRSGKPFYCGSCHETHRSEFARLMRFDSRAPAGYCQRCHKF